MGQCCSLLTVNVWKMKVFGIVDGKCLGGWGGSDVRC